MRRKNSRASRNDPHSGGAMAMFIVSCGAEARERPFGQLGTFGRVAGRALRIDQFRACPRDTRALSFVAIRAPPASGKSIALAVTFQPSTTTRGRAPPRSCNAASMAMVRLSQGSNET